MAKAKLDQPFTMVPNVCFDTYMKEMTANEFQTYMFVIRKTMGWHKSSDKISLSQFKKNINSSTPTIRKAIKGLRKKGFIKQIPSGRSYRYSIIKPSINFKTVKQHGSNGEKNLQGNGKESYSKPCKNLSTQNKTQKKKLNINMSERTKFRNEVSDNEVLSIIDEWNNRFNGKINREDPHWLELIGEVLCYFSKDELKQAMENRPNVDMYQERYRHLLHRPESFFGWLETIENDLTWTPSNIYDYKGMTSIVTDYSNPYTQDDFKERIDLRDENGHAKWELVAKATAH